MDVILEAECLLFDLDGTLINTTKCVEKHWKANCEKHGVDFETLMAFSHGTQTIKVLEKFFPEHMVNEKSVIELEEVVMNDTDGVEVVDGAIEFVKRLPASKWGIVTSGTKKMAETRIIQTSFPPTTAFYTADIVKNSKPHPEGYLRCAQELGADPASCIVFEDAPAGIKAGLEAGCKVVGVVSSHTREQLMKLGVSACIESYNSITCVIENGRILLTIRNGISAN